MKNFDIITTDGYAAVVIGLGYTHVFSELFDATNPNNPNTVNAQLIDMNIPAGTILFDTVLSNGFAPNRFLTLEFDPMKGGLQGILNPTLIDSDHVSIKAREDIHSYFQSNPTPVTSSNILHSAQKYILIHIP